MKQASETDNNGNHSFSNAISNTEFPPIKKQHIKEE